MEHKTFGLFTSNLRLSSKFDTNYIPIDLILFNNSKLNPTSSSQRVKIYISTHNKSRILGGYLGSLEISIQCTEDNWWNGTIVSENKPYCYIKNIEPIIGSTKSWWFCALVEGSQNV